MTAKSVRVLRILVLCGAMTVAGCGATYKNHGYVPPETDLENLVVNVDTRATVDDLIGPPSVSGMVGDGDYYYVRSRKRTFMITPGFKAKLTRYLARSHTGLFRWIVDGKVAKALKAFGGRTAA